MATNQFDDLMENRTAPDANEWDALAKEVIADDESRLKQVKFVASKSDPDQTAQAMKLADKSGLPVDVVQRNLGKVQEKVFIENRDWDDEVNSSPEVSNWVKQDPNNAILVKDDAENVSGIGRLFNYFKNQGQYISEQYEAGDLNIEKSKIGERMFMGEATDEDRARLAAIEKRNAEFTDHGIDGFVEGIPGGVAQMVPLLIETAKARLQGMAVGGATGGALGLAAGPGALVSAAAGASAGGQVASAIALGKIEGFSAYPDFLKVKDENGILLDEQSAKSAALLTGALNGALEVVGMKTLGAVFKKFQKFNPISREAILKNPGIRNKIITVAKELGGLSGEGITEFMQEVVSSNAGELAAMIQDGSISDGTKVANTLLSDEKIAQYIDAGKGGLQGAIGIGAAGAVAGKATGKAQEIWQKRKEQKDIDHAENLEKGLNQLSETIQNSKLKERSPEKTNELISHVAGDGKVYIPRENLEQYFQTKGIDAKAFLEETLGSSDAYDEAVKTGSDIEMPLNLYGQKILTSEHSGFMNSIVRQEVGQMNAVEARELITKTDQESLADANTTEATQEEKIDDAIQTRHQQESAVRSGIYDQLVSAGASDLQAKRESVIATEFLKGLAINEGKTLEEYANQNQLDIQRKESYVEPTLPDRFDTEGKRVYSPELVSDLENRIRESELIKSQAKVDTDGNTIGSVGGASTFPEFFKNKGYKKAEVLKIIEKQKKGEKLTENQQIIFDDLYDGAHQAVASGEYFQFAGRQSQTAPVESLYDAAKRLESGQDPEVIRKETGWFMGQDKRWRYEISDEGAEVIPVRFKSGATYKLSDILKHDELFKAYPQLKDLKVKLGIARGTKAGSYTRATKTLEILVNRERPKDIMPEVQAEFEKIKANPEYIEFSRLWNNASKQGKSIVVRRMKESEVGKRYFELLDQMKTIKEVAPKVLEPSQLNTILHEIQHAIQDIEGFASGAASGRTQFAKNRYFNTHGEVEARNVEARKGFTESQRKESSPDITTWKNPVINWASVTTELPIEEVKKTFDHIASEGPKGQQLTLFQRTQKPSFMEWRQDMPKTVKVTSLENSALSISEAKKQLLGDEESKSFSLMSGGKVKVDQKVFGEIAWHLGNDTQMSGRFSKEEIQAANIVAGNLDKIIPNLILHKREINRKPDSKTSVFDYRLFHGLVKIGDKNFALSLKTERSKNRSQGERVYIESLKLLGPDSLPLFHEPSVGANAQPIGPTAYTGLHEVNIHDFIKIINSVKKTDPYFQSEKAPQGSYVRDFSRHIISLFETADASTFMHETGHAMLEMIMDSKADKLEIKGRVQGWWRENKDHILELAKKREGLSQKVIDEINHSGPEIFDSLLGFGHTKTEAERAVKTEMHEYFARALENYLQTGKAPNSKLRVVFYQFKKLLTNIYKKLTAHNVKMSDDIRAVFDRLLTAEQKVEEVEKDLLLNDTRLDSQALGMSENEAKAFNDARLEAKAKAEGEVLGKLHADAEKLKTKQAKELRAFLIQEKIKEVNQMQVYRVASLLQKGVLPDGSKLDSFPEGLKIDRKSLIKSYGHEIYSKLPKGVTASKDGLSVEIVAEMMGYKDAQSMLKDLSEMKDKGELINELVDQDMAQEYPDLTNTVEFDQAAITDVLNSSHKKILRMELDALMKNDPVRAKSGIKSLIRIAPTSQQIKAEAVKILAKKELKDVKPYIYQRAMIKASKDAALAFGKGKWTEAYNAKMRELLNLELFREAYAAQQTIRKNKEFYKKLFKKDDEIAKTRDLDFVNAARAILTHYGLGRGNRDLMGELDKIKRYDESVYLEIKSLIEQALAESGEVDSLTLEGFYKLHEAIDTLWDLAKANRLMDIDGQSVDFEKAKDEVSKAFMEKAPLNRPGVSEALSNKEKTKMGLMGWASRLRRIESFAALIDGRNINGAITKYIFRPIKDAETRYKLQQIKYLEKLHAITSKHLVPIDNVKINAEGLGYTFQNKGELIAALLHTGNSSNFERLLLGRKWGEMNQEGKLDRTRWDQQIKKFEDARVLTKADWDYVQAIWDLHDETKVEAQKAHKKMYGFYFSEITAEPFQTSIAQLRGGYVPAIADTFLAEDAQIRDSKRVLEESGNAAMFPTAPKGFTKQRVQGYHAPLMLDIQATAKNLDKVLRFTHIEPSVKQVAKLINNKEVRAAINAYDSTVAGEMLIPWLHRSVLQTVRTPSEGAGGKLFDKVASGIRKRTGMQIMVLNITNAMQNFTSVFPATVLVKPKNIGKGFLRYTKDRNGAVEAIMQKSDYMKTRLGSSLHDVKKEIDDIVTYQTKFEKFKDAAVKYGYILERSTQNIVDVAIWQGSYDQMVANGATETDAIRHADSTVRQVQSGSSASDVSRMETGTTFQSLFMMFSTYFNTMGNLLTTELAIAKEMGFTKEGTKRGFYAYLMVIAAPSIAAALIGRMMAGVGLDEDDDGEYWDDALEIFFGSQFRMLTAMVPGGAIANSILAQFNDKPYDDRINLSPVATMVEQSVKASKDLYRATQGEGKTSNAIRSAFTAVGLASGLPLTPVAKPLVYLSDVAEGEADPTGPVDFTRGLVTGKKGK